MVDVSKEEREGFLQPQDAAQNNNERGSYLGRMWPYIRLVVEVAMVLCIFVLSTSLSKPRSAHSLQKTPIPERKRDIPNTRVNCIADRSNSASETLYLQRRPSLPERRDVQL